MIDAYIHTMGCYSAIKKKKKKTLPFTIWTNLEGIMLNEII